MKKPLMAIGIALGAVATAFAAVSYFTDGEETRKKFWEYYDPRNWVRKDKPDEEYFETIDPMGVSDDNEH